MPGELGVPREKNTNPVKLSMKFEFASSSPLLEFKSTVRPLFSTGIQRRSIRMESLPTSQKTLIVKTAVIPRELDVSIASAFNEIRAH